MSGMHSSRIASYAFVFFFFFPERILWRMACFVVAVVSDAVAVIICRPSASGRVGTLTDKNKFVLLRA